MESSENEIRLAAILETMLDGVITIDGAGIMQSCNPAACRLFGYAADELIGRNVNILMPAPYHEEHDGYLRAFQETGVRRIIGYGREVVGVTKTGRRFPMDLAVTELRLGDRRWFTGIVRDVSARKAAEERQEELVARLQQLNDELEERVDDRTRELRAAQEELVKRERLAMLGRISGGVAHEIRNPLNSVRMSAYYLLNARELQPEKLREHLERIDRQVSHANAVITTLTDFARQPAPKVSCMDVSEWMSRLSERLKTEESVAFRTRSPDESVQALADPDQLAIAMRNLIVNARDACRDGGEIEVAWRLVVSDADPKPTVRIEVHDTGHGMDAETLQRILEPLYTTKARGMGLGLAIVDAIVQRNGGRLEVSSESGKGSTFAMLLPAVDST